MLKTYDLASRHFGWEKPPAASTEREIAAYRLDRALRAQGVVSLDSICHLDAPRKPAIRRLVEARARGDRDPQRAARAALDALFRKGPG